MQNLKELNYGLNDRFTKDPKTGLFLPVNHSVPFYPLQKYHYSGKHVFIDSLRVRIPLWLVKILDSRMIRKYMEFYIDEEDLINDFNAVDDETGELFAGAFGAPGEFEKIERKKSNGFIRVIHGITYRFFFKSFLDPKDPNNPKEYLVIQISSKMAKREYFDGITILNIEQILNDINAFKVVYLTLKDFLNGLVSDIDICTNYFVTLPNLKYSFALMKSFARPGVTDKIKVIQREKSKNIGISFNERNRATPSMPFLKIYHKGFELESKHTLPFYMEYLEPMFRVHLNYLVRYEMTIRNTEHRKYLIKKGLNAGFDTLEDLLYTQQEDLHKILQSGLPLYLQTKPRLKVNRDALGNRDLLDIELFTRLIFRGEPQSYFFSLPEKLSIHIKDDNVRRQNKHRLTKIITFVWEAITSLDSNTKELLKRNANSSDFLGVCGFDISNIEL